MFTTIIQLNFNGVYVFVPSLGIITLQTKCGNVLDDGDGSVLRL